MAALHLPSCLSQHLPADLRLPSIRLPSIRLPSLQLPSLRLPNMLSIASLFDDEQRLLNRVWIILLGLEALLVLIGAVSAIVQGVVAMRLRRRRRLQTDEKTEAVWLDAQPRSPRTPGAARKRVTIVLPATVVDDLHRPMTPTIRTAANSPEFGPLLFDSPAAKV